MVNIQKNQANIAHVFEMVQTGTGRRVEFVIVPQVCPTKYAARNAERCRVYLQSRLQSEYYMYRLVQTGDVEPMRILYETLCEGLSIEA